MPELRELQRRVESIHGLREVVNAMRNLAAVYVRRAESTLRAIRPYADVVATALRVALARAGMAGLAPPEDSPSLIVVFGSDQGLAGAYNNRAVGAALDFQQGLQGQSWFASVGLRARSLLAARGVKVGLAARAPSSLEGIRARVPELAAHIFDAYQESGARRVFFVFNVFESMGRFGPCVRRVVPPVPEELAAESARTFSYDPLPTAPPRQLLEHLIEEYFFVELYRSLLESHASENGARLTAMTAAASNIDDRLDGLQREYQSLRQESITAELMDVVSGAEALRDDAD